MKANRLNVVNLDTDNSFCLNKKEVDKMMKLFKNHSPFCDYDVEEFESEDGDLVLPDELWQLLWDVL
jgi:hypothetical protein